MDRLQHALDHGKAKLDDYLSRRRTYVYVLGCDGFVKIGIASNPRKRISELQVGSPHRIEFLGLFPTIKAKEDEKQLHREFKEFRKTGEWFALDEHKLRRLLARACYILPDM